MTQETLVPRDARFNTKIDLYRRAVGADNSFGEPSITLTLVQADVWAAIRGDSATNLWKSAEAYRAGQVITASPVDFYLHYSSDYEPVNEQLVIRYNGVDLNTLYIENVNARNRYIQVLSELGKDAV